MKPDQINYTTDPERAYVIGIDHAATLEALKSHVRQWRLLAADAAEAVGRLDEAGFDAFQKARRKERRGCFMGEENMERFGDILMPQILFMTSILAHRFNVPWGLAFIRLREAGRIQQDTDGTCRWVGEAEAVRRLG